jgi:hypothetical protein
MEATMLPQDLYALRGLEYAELANQAQDFEMRHHYRHLAAYWLRLADYARQQGQIASRIAA